MDSSERKSFCFFFFRERRARLLACLLLCAWTNPTPDVVVYALPGLRGAMLRVAADFRARTGVEVHLFTAPPAGLIGLVRHRARDDVVVADDATLAALQGLHLLRAPAPVALGRDAYALIVARRAGGAPRERVVTDPTTAATFDGQAIAARIATLPAAVMGVADTPYVVAAVADATDRVGLVRVSDAYGEGRVRIATVLPAAVAQPARLQASVVSNAQSAKAGEFLSFLDGAEARGVLRDAGIAGGQ